MSEPAWRTTTVLDLCRAMRHTQDYSALPVLADALEEAGYTDCAGLLAAMRAGPGPVEGCRLVARVYSNETASAADMIESIVAEMGTTVMDEEDPLAEGAALPHNDWGDRRITMTWGYLMAAAARYRETGEVISEYMIHWSNVFFDREKDFWRAYYLVTGRTPEPGEEESGDFVFCSC